MVDQLNWILVDEAYLTGLQAPLSPLALKRYFDGQLPTFRHALSPGIPRRELVKTIVADVQRSIDAHSPGMWLLLGGGGEGKSTMLLQAAADVARAGQGSKVLWRPTGETPLAVDAAIALPPGPWLLVSDDANTIANELHQLVRALHQAGRDDVHLLLAARDTDWQHMGGEVPAWSQYLSLRRETLRGIDKADATELVRAWAAAGDEILGPLGRRPREIDRVRELLKATRAEARDHEGSFFGGILQVRYGAEGLRAHVRDIMNRLGERSLRGGHTLREAFLFVAALDAVKIDGLDARVLADLLEVPRDRVATEVLGVLGEEAAAIHTGTLVRTRHRSIAQAALVLVVRDKSTEDLGELYSRIVKQTKDTRNSGIYVGGDQSWFGNVLHIAPTVASELPPDIAPSPRAAIAVRTAKANIEAQPDRLSPYVTLARTWRALKQPAEGIEALRGAVSRLKDMVDYETDVRGFWFEWSVCEIERKRFEVAVFIAAYSISDALNPVPITLENAKHSLTGLGAALHRLLDRDGGTVYETGLRAVAVLGMFTDPDRNDFLRYTRAADELRVPVPQFAEAFSWLEKTIVHAGQRGSKSISTAGLALDMRRDALTFQLLRTVLSTEDSQTKGTKPGNRLPPTHARPRSLSAKAGNSNGRPT